MKYRRKPKWAKKITATEWRHLCDNRSDTKYRLELQKDYMIKTIADNPGKDKRVLVCMDCMAILRKLGMWEETPKIASEYESFQHDTSSDPKIGNLCAETDCYEQSTGIIKIDGKNYALCEKHSEKWVGALRATIIKKETDTWMIHTPDGEVLPFTINNIRKVLEE